MISGPTLAPELRVSRWISGAGRDIPDEAAPVSTFMQDYRTGGTPWFTVITPSGQISYANFHIDPTGFLLALSGENATHEA